MLAFPSPLDDPLRFLKKKAPAAAAATATAPAVPAAIDTTLPPPEVVSVSVVNVLAVLNMIYLILAQKFHQNFAH